MHLDIYVDGASWGNPGPAAVGAVIRDEKQRELFKLSQYIGERTNNQAEYQAAIAGLRGAIRFKPSTVTLYLDSELVARQLTGKYKVRNLLLLPLYKEAAELCKKFANLSIVHVGHDGNTAAHSLAQAALKNFKKHQA